MPFHHICDVQQVCEHNPPNIQGPVEVKVGGSRYLAEPDGNGGGSVTLYMAEEGADFPGDHADNIRALQNILFPAPRQPAGEDHGRFDPGDHADSDFGAGASGGAEMPMVTLPPLVPLPLPARGPLAHPPAHIRRIEYRLREEINSSDFVLGSGRQCQWISGRDLVSGRVDLIGRSVEVATALFHKFRGDPHIFRAGYDVCFVALPSNSREAQIIRNPEHLPLPSSIGHAYVALVPRGPGDTLFIDACRCDYATRSPLFIGTAQQLRSSLQDLLTNGVANYRGHIRDVVATEGHAPVVSSYLEGVRAINDFIGSGEGTVEQAANHLFDMWYGSNMNR